MEVNASKFRNKLKHFSFSWGHFFLHLSEITIKKVTPVEMPQHDNISTCGNMW